MQVRARARVKLGLAHRIRRLVACLALRRLGLDLGYLPVFGRLGLRLLVRVRVRVRVRIRVRVRVRVRVRAKVRG